jgi:hypothetical protein
VQHLDDSFALAAEPQTIAARLIATCEEFGHLKEADPLLLFLFSERAIPFRGGFAAAVIIEPRWQGPLGLVAEFLLAHFGKGQLGAPLDADYIVVVDASNWRSLDAERRERLMFHELSHLVAREDEFGVVKRSSQTGQPLLKLVQHDYEAFDSEIRRYGLHTCGFEAIAPAIVEGEARKRRRGLRIA